MARCSNCQKTHFETVCPLCGLPSEEEDLKGEIGVHIPAPYEKFDLAQALINSGYERVEKK